MHAPFRGRFYSYDEGWFGPPPPQGAKLPILIGGHSERALERAATLGDIWQSTSLSPEDFKPKAAWIRAHAGTRHVEVGARTILVGDPDAVLARIKEFEAAGAEHVCAYFGKRPEDFVPAMRAFAREVMPALST